VVPILRAGLVLLEQTSMVLPASQTYHVGYVRDDDTLQVGAADGWWVLPPAARRSTRLGRLA
jgi:uracil phosphoribosyltransferase